MHRGRANSVVLALACVMVVAFGGPLAVADEGTVAGEAAVPRERVAADGDAGSELGTAEVNWRETGGRWYCYGVDGVRLTGWVFDGDAWFYLRPATDDPTDGPEGSMVVDWAQIDGFWYFFGGDGRMQLGRVFWGPYEYYMSDEYTGGAVGVPDRRSEGAVNTFDDQSEGIFGRPDFGRMITGFVRIGSFDCYYAEPSSVPFVPGTGYPEGAMVKDRAYTYWSPDGTRVIYGEIDSSGHPYTYYALSEKYTWLKWLFPIQ